MSDYDKTLADGLPTPKPEDEEAKNLTAGLLVVGLLALNLLALFLYVLFF